MSLIVEIGGFLGGMLSEYARRKKWSKLKTFMIVSFSFFILGALYVVLIPSTKEKWTGIFIAAIIGWAIGLVSVLLMFLEKWCRDKRRG